jgi:hypothetical protein
MHAQQLETVMVKSESAVGYAIINSTDFDPKTHELFTGEVPGALREDGPTFEEYIQRGYSAKGYPPAGYVALDSQGWREYQHAQALAAAPPALPVVAPADVPPAVVVPPADVVPPAADKFAILDGNADSAKVAVAAMADVDVLQRVRAAELAGKGRSTVISTIDARLAELTKPRQ